MSSETDADTAAQSTSQSNASTDPSINTSETNSSDGSDTHSSPTEADKTATDTTTTAATDQEASTTTDQDETVPETEQPAQSFTASIAARHLMHIVDLTRAIVDEARLQLDATTGLSIRAVDPANVAMVDLTLPPDIFTSFTTSGGALGVNLDRLQSILSLASVDDLIQLSLNADSRKLTIQIDGLEYTLALIDLKAIAPPPELPELELPAHVQLEYETFDRALTAAEMVANHLTFRMEPDTEQFVTEASGDTDDMELKLDADELSEVTIGPAESLFSIGYLTKMKQAIPKDTEHNLSIGEELPLILDLDFTDKSLTAQYLLAPRLKGD